MEEQQTPKEVQIAHVTDELIRALAITRDKTKQDEALKKIASLKEEAVEIGLSDIETEITRRLNKKTLEIQTFLSKIKDFYHNAIKFNSPRSKSYLEEDLEAAPRKILELIVKNGGFGQNAEALGVIKT